MLERKISDDLLEWKRSGWARLAWVRRRRVYVDSASK